MTTLTQALSRDYELGDINEFPVLADTMIHEGAAVGFHDSGCARPLEAGDRFLGFCEDTADNVCGKNGSRMVRVKHGGKVKLPVEGLLCTHIGQSVFARDDNSFTLNAEHNSRIGFVYRFESEGLGIIAFDAAEVAKIA